MKTIKTSKGYTNVKDLIESELGPLTPEENIAFAREEVTEEISETLFSMRLAKNTTREELARKMGVDVDEIVRIESYGDSVKYSDIIKFAGILGYKVSLRFASP